MTHEGRKRRKELLLNVTKVAAQYAIDPIIYKFLKTRWKDTKVKAVKRGVAI